MPNSVNCLPQNNSDNLSHPFLPNLKTSQEDKAKQLHRLLLDLAKDESEKELKSIYRRTADFFRDSVFGKSEKQIRACLLEVFKEYFDGETFVALEIENLAEETGISADKLQPVLDQMVARGEVLMGRRRRWQEAGKHYNPIYKLKK